MNPVSYEEGLQYQKEQAEIAKKEIARMPKMLPGQFKAQCERLKAQSREQLLVKPLV